MKLSSLLVLPAAASAFAPMISPAVQRVPTFKVGMGLGDDVQNFGNDMSDNLRDAAKKIDDTTEDYVEKADSLFVRRAMRVINHAPILVTLKALADKAGMSVSQAGIAAAPEAFAAGGAATALTVPTWCYNVWALAALSQLASVAKSALASDDDELSQADITATAASNFAAARMIGSANPLRDTLITAVVSGFALRNNGADGPVTIHNASAQLVASFTTTLAALGLVSFISSNVPILKDMAEVTPLLGVAAMWVINARKANGTVKKAVNGGILAGILYNGLIGGVSFAMDASSILTNSGLFLTAYVAAEAVNNVRKAVFN